MKKLLLLSIIVFTYLAGFGQYIATKNLEIKYTFVPDSNVKKAIFTCLIPNNLPHIQTILATTYSKEPLTIFESETNKYARFQFENIDQPFDLTITIALNMYRRDFKTAKTTPLFQNDSLNPFLMEEKFIDLSEPIIKLKATELKESDQLKTVKNIFNFVMLNIDYIGFTGYEFGASKSLTYKKGDCTEFSDLFVALCRSNGIPAKVVEGYTTEQANTPLHSWAEVYLEKYGWVRVDPTPNNPISFSQLHNKYVQLSTNRNDSLLNYNHRWFCKFFGGKVSVYEEVRVID